MNDAGRQQIDDDAYTDYEIRLTMMAFDEIEREWTDIPDWEHHYSAAHETHVRADWTDPASPVDLGIVDCETGAVTMWVATVYQVADCDGREDAARRVHEWTASQCG